MRNSTVKSFAYGIAMTASAIAGFVYAAKASADTAELTAQQNDYVNKYEQYICGSVISNPTYIGVHHTIQLVINDGWSAYDAGLIVGYSVNDSCPAQIPALQKFIDTVNASQTASV